MPISVEVGLLSGRAAPVHAGLDEQVRALKRRAQIALGVGMGACRTHLDVFWIDVLRPGKPDCGMVIHDRVQVCSANTALAAVLGDGSVVPWRDAGNGGDSRAVQDRLKTVLRIEASADAFAAMLGDGSVMTCVMLTRAATVVQCTTS